MGEASQRRDPVELLAEQYVEALRRGERPDVDELAALHPEHAAQIRDLFPLLEVIEQRVAGPPTWQGAAAPTLPPLGSRSAAPVWIGQYRIVRELGRGGMGIVYEAEQPSLGRHVAIKLLVGSSVGDEYERRLRAEALALGRLEHPHIVPVFEVGEHEGRAFFSMALIGGGTLAQRLSAGPLHDRPAAELLLPICRAIAEAHRSGIVHRDLKPSNILLDRQARPLVADFGLARSFAGDALTQTGSVAGTPSYMAPEQAVMHGTIGPATDVYGLGAVLYELLTGRPPFRGASPMETLMMVLEDPPPAPSVIQPRVDRRLEAIALKCLRKQAAERYGSADALADDLRAFLDDEPVSACRFRLADLLSMAVRETRHAAVLEQWGREWIALGAFLGVTYALTAALKLLDYRDHGAYYLLWMLSAPVWIALGRWLHQADKGVSLIERQIAHMSIASTWICVMTLVLEGMLDLPPLELSPIFAAVGCAQFLAKGNLLSHAFYIQATAYFITAIVMANLVRADYHAAAMLLLALLAWAAFTVPGVFYYRRGRRTAARTAVSGKPRVA